MKHQPVKQGQTTTLGTPCPKLYDKCVGSLTSPADYITLKMHLRRLDHLTICRVSNHLSVGPVWGSNLRPPAQQSGALSTELTGRRFEVI